MIQKEKTLSSQTVFEGKIFTVKKDFVELDNHLQGYREVIYHNGGVAIIAVDDDCNTYLVNQFRYPLMSPLLELPAGKREKDEDPLLCGQRELEEEIGAVAKKWTSLGISYSSPGCFSEKIYLYLAQDLQFTKQNLDEDEFLDIIKMPLEQAYQLVMSNELTDGKSQTAILKAYNIINVR